MGRGPAQGGVHGPLGASGQVERGTSHRGGDGARRHVRGPGRLAATMGVDMKAVLQYRASPGFRTRLRELAPPWLDAVVVEEADKEAFALNMKDAMVLLHVLEPVTAEVIAGAPDLRLIQKIGIGVNTIDL